MQIFKPSGAELEQLQGHAIKLKEANAVKGKSDKLVEASKAALSKWLLDERKLDIQTLQIGDMVQIEGVVLIEISAMSKFDEKGFLIAQPVLHAEYKKDLLVKKFKPLV